MEENNYSLKTILDTLSKIKGGKAKKRLIFDQTPIDGIGSRWVIAFFISLPILLYIGIFNPVVFPMLGIAQAIIFYVVFLSMVMIMIIALTFINNNKVLREIKPSWDHYFPGIDIKLILSSGATPYKDFFNYYSSAVADSADYEEIYLFLQNAFIRMKEENADLIEAMNSARSR
ncbi:MAG: hypothetical protein U9O64_03970 [Campylobacterota bacterium]|nr:hypothetical protein [Campylobacterota bacterium]